jgi:putative membrane protein
MAEGERDYLSKAIRHYSSLFTFPSYRVLLTSMFVVVTALVAAAFLIVSFSAENLFRGIIFGLGILLLPTVCADLISSRLFKNAVLNLRRLTALSTVATSAWALIITAGMMVQTTTGFLGLARSTFLGASLVIGFRFLVVRSVAPLKPLSHLLVTLLPPGLCLILAMFLYWLPLFFPLFLATVVSASLLVLVGEVLLRILDKHGKESVGVGALVLFRGFVSDWLEGIADPLEEYLEELAVSADASASLLEFVHNNETQGLIVVSDVHPGPFKNVGSSNIPYEIQAALESKTMAFVMVPHGASGHERDLASKEHCRRLVKGLIETDNLDKFSTLASPVVRFNKGDAHASCQFFGDIAFVTLTCAPKSMEDIPFELGEEIVEKGKALGAEDIVVVDAHNSIGDKDEVPVLLPEQLSNLKVAAESAIEGALKLGRAGFRFGASRVVPKEFGLREGLGPGGIAVVVIEVQNRKMAYVTFDGNNLVRGLREEIREALRDVVDESEVLATDTHVVNAISTIERGYHPVGEMGGHETLLSHVRRCTSEALSRLQESICAYHRIDVPGVRVIGEEKLKSLSLLVDSSIVLLKRLTVLIYGPAMILVTLMLLLLP